MWFLFVTVTFVLGLVPVLGHILEFLPVGASASHLLEK